MKLLAALILPLCLHATIARVGHAESGATSNVTSKSVAYAPTTGNAIFIACSVWSGGNGTYTTQTVGDGGTNTYTLAKSKFFTNTTVSIYYNLSVTGGSYTYTCTNNGVPGNNFPNIFVVEYSGLAGGSTDGTPTEGTGQGAPIATAALTTTSSQGLLLSVWGFDDFNGTLTSVAPNSGYSTVASFLNGNSTSESGVIDQITSASGAYTAGVTRTPTGVSQHWVIIQAAFKAFGSLTKVSISVQ